MSTITVTIEEIRHYRIPDTDDDTIQRVLDDAISQLDVIAPGITTLDPTTLRGAAAVVRGAVVRYLETTYNLDNRTGVTSTSDTAGPWSTSSTYRDRTTIYLPSEERKLKQAAERGRRRAFAVELNARQHQQSWAERMNAGQTHDADQVSERNRRIFTRCG